MLLIASWYQVVWGGSASLGHVASDEEIATLRVKAADRMVAKTEAKAKPPMFPVSIGGAPPPTSPTSSPMSTPTSGVSALSRNGHSTGRGRMVRIGL